MNARLYTRTNRPASPAGRRKARAARAPAGPRVVPAPNRQVYSRKRRRESAFDVWSLCETL